MKAPQDLEQWAASQNTSQEIASAIEDMASSDAARMQEIWENPTEDEIAEVVNRAWKEAGSDEDELFWGCETISR